VPRDRESEARIVRLVSEEHYSYNQVARLLNMTPQRVGQVFKRWRIEHSGPPIDGTAITPSGGQSEANR